MIMDIKIVKEHGVQLPEQATDGAAGLDLRANINEPLTLMPNERKLIPTGVKIELPVGFEAQIRPRSGMVLKQGLTVLNSPGTIDSDYRGDIGVILHNSSDGNQIINPKDRIAQMVIARYEKVTLIPVQKLSSTDRNKGGFGSTGKQ